MRKVFLVILLSFLVVCVGLATVTAQTVASSLGMVAAVNPYAAEVGAKILEEGGNALDAAIAVSYALGVVEPYASGLGGEGYAIISLASGEKYAVDFKAMTPAAATYEKLKELGLKISTVNYTPKGALVPGIPAGTQKVWELGATMPMAELIQPAIDLAKNGIIVNETFAQTVSDGYEKLIESAPDFLNDGLAWEVGDLFTNEDLAETLEIIAQEGVDSFYTGTVAEKIAAFMAENDGFITAEDLGNYVAYVKEPIHGTYRGYDLYVPHPPVSGPQLIAVMNILENFNLSALSWDDPLAVHIIQQVLTLEDVDRKYYISDPDFFDLPINGFTSKEFAKMRFMEIDLAKAIDPDTYFDHIGNAYPYENGEIYERVMLEEASKEALAAEDVYEHPSTTHFSIVDKYGNAVSWTQTISSFWGTSSYLDGFFFNNEIGNFASSYREGDIINLTPGIRVRTTICPTIIEKDGKVKYVIGTPGGGRIISTIVQLIVDVIDFNMPIDQAVKTPKFVGYSSYKDVRIESGYPAETIDFLSEVLGHKINEYAYPDLFFGGPNIISVEDDGMMIGAGSIRRNGAASAPEM